MRAAILTIRDVWQAGYQRLISEALADGRVQIRPDDKERRSEPRFCLEGRNVLAPDLGPVTDVDVSATGVALTSGVPAPVGSRLTVSLANAFCTETTVVDCQPASAARDPESGYLVRGRFIDEAHGLQFVTLALELERVERD